MSWWAPNLNGINYELVIVEDHAVGSIIHKLYDISKNQNDDALAT
jgi:hypothetical protein